MTGNNDILLDENEDLMIKNGDLVVGPSDDQHLRHNFYGGKGSFRNPYIGFGAAKYIKSTGQELRFKRDLKVALKLDNYELTSIENANGQVKILAE